MSAKLRIPERTRFTRPLSVSFRSLARPWLRKEVRELTQTKREALMWSVLICTTLWGLFWFQFVISILYNLPGLYTLSGGIWYPPPIEFYQENSGPFPWSLAGTFVFISVFAASLGLVGACLRTHGVEGKWRMRFAVLIFSTILCGWSIACLRAESGVAKGLEKRIERARELWKWAASDGEEERILKYYRMEVERLEGLLEKSR